MFTLASALIQSTLSWCLRCALSPCRVCAPSVPARPPAPAPLSSYLDARLCENLPFAHDLLTCDKDQPISHTMIRRPAVLPQAPQHRQPIRPLADAGGPCSQHNTGQLQPFRTKDTDANQTSDTRRYSLSGSLRMTRAKAQPKADDQIQRGRLSQSTATCLPRPITSIRNSCLPLVIWRHQRQNR